jgi:hypothetical protein
MNWIAWAAVVSFVLAWFIPRLKGWWIDRQKKKPQPLSDEWWRHKENGHHNQ